MRGRGGVGGGGVECGSPAWLTTLLLVAVPTDCREHKAPSPEPAESRNSINVSFCYYDCIIFSRKWPKKGIKREKAKSCYL